PAGPRASASSAPPPRAPLPASSPSTASPAPDPTPGPPQPRPGRAGTLIDHRTPAARTPDPGAGRRPVRPLEKGAPPRDRSRRRGPAALTVPDAASLLTTHADGTTRHWLPTLNSWGSGTSGRRPGGAEQGPSPRAWGSRRSAAVALLSTGSIPTCVG